ncbi:MAG TPA: ParB/RepB/Spo0J family partition protein [Candidatus Krumholzibacteria bacterium]
MNKTFIVESIAISKVHVGERRRESVGSLAGMKSSLERVGQIHPITVRMNGSGFELVAGQRRLKAAESLGWTRIRARVGNFDDDTLRAIELEENTVRLDLTPFEAGAERMKQIAAEEAEIEAEEVLAQDAPKPSGRPRGGDREVARRTGFSRDEIRRTRKHVAQAKAVPAFQGADWSRSQVDEAAQILDSLPAKTRDLAVDMISEPGTPAKDAVQIVKTLKEPDLRPEIQKLYRSDDPEERSLAKTRAARKPPMPPKRLAWIREAIRLTEHAIDDSLRVAQGDLRSALTSLKAALKASEEHHRERRVKEGH